MRREDSKQVSCFVYLKMGERVKDYNVVECYDTHTHISD